MDWIKTEHSFIYQGEEVTRLRYRYRTPFGDTTVEQSVSGKVLIRPLTISQISFNGETTGTIIQFNRIDCPSIEEGLRICEKAIEDFKLTINNI